MHQRLGFCFGYFAFYVYLAFVFKAATQGLAIENEAEIKKLLLNQLTPEEYNLFFGDLRRDPLFFLVRPSLLPHQVAGNSGARILKISYAGTSVEVVVFPSDTLLAPHIRKGGITVGGEPIAYTPNSCHYRFSNRTVVVSVNDCHPRSLDGVILTENHVGVFHPVPQRLMHLIHEEKHQNSSSLQENLCDYHIFHLADKSSLSVPLRMKRSVSNASGDLSDENLCATDDEHDMTGRATARDGRILKTPSLRTLDELVPDLEEDLNMITNDSLLRNENRNELSRIPITIVKKKTIELAVFCDDVLYRNFPQKLKDSKSTRLFDYLLTLVNAIQGIYHQEELQGYVLDLLIVKLDIQTSANQGPRKSGGDIGAYLSSFCDWQKERNPTGEATPGHWDHAFMLSGLDLHSSGNPSVIGLAWVSGMCRPSISCTMNEGRSFMAVYVVAHELGHNLGMSHDGHGAASGCNSGKYIMSPSVGPGKTTWSRCSIEVIHRFLRQSSCLDDGAESRADLRVDTSTAPLSDTQSVSVKSTHSPLPPFLKALRDRTPGHRFPLIEQCQAVHGRDYFPALTKIDLCEYLYCTNGVLTKPAHPALEGSPCGPHRICLGGKCRPEEELSRYVHLYGGMASGAAQIAESPTESPPYDDLPVITVSGDEEDTCTCAKLPTVTKKSPTGTCPVLAPAFYPLFGCTEQCSKEDLFIQFESGHFYQIVNGKKIEDDTEVCSLVDQILSTTDIHEGLLENFSSLQISRKEFQVLCSVMPEFISSVLPCSQTIDVGKCLPQHIILGISGYNFTYVEQNTNQNKNQIKWKGKNYSLLRSSGDQRLESSLHDLLDRHHLLPFSKCNQDDEFLDNNKISLTELCPYLPHSLQSFFNCSLQNQACQNSVIFLDSKSHLATRVPVRTITEPKELSKCNRCPEAFEDLNNILTNLMGISDEVLEKVCHLIPSAWVESIQACDTTHHFHFYEDKCLPNTLVVQGNKFDFTYSLREPNERDLTQTSIEWKGHPYFLKIISYAGKQAEEELEIKYNVDFSRKHTFKFHQSELKTTSRVTKYRSNSKGDSSTVLKSSNAPWPLKDELHFEVNSTLERMENLQEYIGQRDAYLASNAALVMPRTYVGPCSVTCGRGVRPINVECVDVTTEEVVDDGSCQGFIDTEINMEPCIMPPCSAARWTIEDWGPCSESCGSGVQYRDVICAIRLPVDQSNAAQLRSDIEIVVDGSQCSGKQPNRVRECTGQCELPVWCANEDCLDYQDVQISKDFDY